MYEAIPAEQMQITDEEDNGHGDEDEAGELSKDLGQTETLKRKRLVFCYIFLLIIPHLLFLYLRIYQSRASMWKGFLFLMEYTLNWSS